MKHLNIPAYLANDIKETPPAQTNQFSKYLLTPTIPPQPNILIPGPNKNDFIQFLVKVSEALIQSHAPKINSNFVYELLQRSKATLSLVQVTLIYYIRAKQKIKNPYFWLQEEKLFIGCIMIAHLYLMDSTYKLKSWEIITGLDSQLLKLVRHMTLETLDHRLATSREIYAVFNCKLLEMYKQRIWTVEDLVGCISKDAALNNKKHILTQPEPPCKPTKKRKYMEIPN